MIIGVNSVFGVLCPFSCGEARSHLTTSPARPAHGPRSPLVRFLLVGLVAGSGVFRGYSLITVSRGAATTGKLEVFGLDAPLCEKTCGGAAVAAQIERSFTRMGAKVGDRVTGFSLRNHKSFSFSSLGRWV